MLVSTDRFQVAREQIGRLKADERYQAAFIFGSVARGDASASSDLDVQVVVDREESCAAINHPVIDGVKLDVTFLTFAQLAARTEREIERAARVPMVAESFIVFDKTGELTALRDAAQEARPKPCTPADVQAIQFGIFHAHDKAQRGLAADPLRALLVMHISVRHVLDAHYQLQRRWRVSDKRMLDDLRNWDPAVATLLEQLVTTSEARPKFAIWTKLVDYVTAPLGGRVAIADLNCSCRVCAQDLAALAKE